MECLPTECVPERSASTSQAPSTAAAAGQQLPKTEQSGGYLAGSRQYPRPATIQQPYGGSTQCQHAQPEYGFADQH